MRTRFVAGSLVVALVTLAGCAGGHEANPVDPHGVVAPLSLLHSHALLDVDLGSEPLRSFGLGEWAQQIVVLDPSAPVGDRAVATAYRTTSITTEGEVRVDDRVGHLRDYGGGPGCAGRTLELPADAPWIIEVSGVVDASDERLIELARHVHWRDGSIVVEGVDHRQLGGDWLRGGDGTRVTTQEHSTYAVRRVDAQEQELIAGLRCPDPVRRLTPPASTSPSELRGFGSRRVHRNGRVIDLGVSGSVQLALIRGRSGIVVLRGIDYGRLGPPDALVDVTAAVDVVPVAELRRRDEALASSHLHEAVRRLQKDLRREGGNLLTTGRSGDAGWAFSRRTNVLGKPKNQLCWDPLVDVSGRATGAYAYECIEDDRGPLVAADVPYYGDVDHAWCVAGPGADHVVVEIGARPAAVAEPIDVDLGNDKRLFFARLDPPVGVAVFGSPNRFESPITLRAFDAAGHELGSQQLR